MIQHIVLMKVPEARLEDVKTTVREIAALQVDGFLGLDASANLSPENRKQGFNFGFVGQFRSWQSLEAYQTHPEHQRQGAQLLGSLSDPDQDLLVFDLESQ